MFDFFLKPKFTGFFCFIICIVFTWIGYEIHKQQQKIEEQEKIFDKEESMPEKDKR